VSKNFGKDFPKFGAHASFPNVSKKYRNNLKNQGLYPIYQNEPKKIENFKINFQKFEK
jgi:hypothetical protein